VWLHFPQTINLWPFIDELFFKIRNLQQNIPLKRKCFLLVIFSQINITAHDAPKIMHPRYSSKAPLCAPHNLCPKAWACIIYKWARGKLF